MNDEKTTTGVQHTILKQAMQACCLQLEGTKEFRDNYKALAVYPDVGGSSFSSYAIFISTVEDKNAMRVSDAIGTELILTRSGPIQSKQLIEKIVALHLKAVAEAIVVRDEYMLRQKLADELRTKEQIALTNLLIYANGDGDAPSREEAKLLVKQLTEFRGPRA